MIIETVTGLVFWLIGIIFDGFQIVSLPLSLISSLLGFIKVGVWVVGADLFAITFASIIFWLSFKFVGGLLVFIWRLLPLT